MSETMTKPAAGRRPKPRLWILLAPVFVLVVTILVLLSIAGIGSWLEQRHMRPRTLAEYNARAASEAATGESHPVVLRGHVAMQGDWAQAAAGWSEHQMVQNGEVLDSLVLDDDTAEVIIYYHPSLLPAAPQMGTRLEIIASVATSETSDMHQGLVAHAIELVP